MDSYSGAGVVLMTWGVHTLRSLSGRYASSLTVEGRLRGTLHTPPPTKGETLLCSEHSSPHSQISPGQRPLFPGVGEVIPRTHLWHRQIATFQAIGGRSTRASFLLRTKWVERMQRPLWLSPKTSILGSSTVRVKQSPFNRMVSDVEPNAWLCRVGSRATKPLLIMGQAKMLIKECCCTRSRVDRYFWLFSAIT